MENHLQQEPLWGAWHIDAQIGRSGRAVVYRVFSDTPAGRIYAAAKKIGIPMDETQLYPLYEEGMQEADVRRHCYEAAAGIVQQATALRALPDQRHIAAVEDITVLERPGGEMGYDIWMRMELLTGLLHYARTYALPPAEVGRMALHVTLALGAAYGANIFHHHISAQNIFISASGDYKLADFSLARRLCAMLPGPDAPAPGPSHAGPFAEDQYMLGLVMYGLLNKNRAPFLPPYPLIVTPADRDTAMGRRLYGERVPPPQDADAGIAALLQRMLAPDPRERFASPMELYQALEAYITRGAIVPAYAAPPSAGVMGKGGGGSSKKKWIWGGAAVLAAGALVVFLASGMLGGDSEAGPADQMPAATQPAGTESTPGGAAEAPADTADGELAIPGGTDTIPETMPEPTPEPTPEPEQANIYGNTVGNNVNCGLAAKQGDWVYFCNWSDNYSLYKMRTDGSEKTKLSNDNSWSLSVVGDWVYYRNASDGDSFCKVRTDGSFRTRMTKDNIWYINIVGEWIYFSNWSDNGYLYKMREDGSNKTRLNTAKSGYINVVDDWIYYRNADDGGAIYVIGTNGYDNARIGDACGEFINVVDGWIYYSNENDSGRLYKMRTDGSENTRLNNDSSYNINLSGEWIYFRNGSDNDYLYKIRIDGTEQTQLNTDNSTYINVVDDWVYYEHGGESGNAYMVRTDGTGRRMIGADDGDAASDAPAETMGEATGEATGEAAEDGQEAGQPA